jgi:hypothetical protein
VFYARNLLIPTNADIDDKYIWVIGPERMAADKPRYLLLRGMYRRETHVFHVSDFWTLGNDSD